MKKLPIFIFFIIIFLFESPKTVLSAVLFQDNFNDGIADGWTALNGGGYWHFYSGMYGATINTPSTVANIVADGTDYEDYIYEIDMIALQGEDKNLIFRVIDLDNRYGFHVSYGSLKLEKRTNGWERDVISAPINFNNGQVYRMKVIVNGNVIEIYQDGTFILRYKDNESDAISHGKVGLRVGAGAIYPSRVYYDNIIVTSIEPSPTPTPTLQPLIFLPGLGASWNHEAMILDQEKPPEDWYMTPGVKSYDGIIQTFQNAGYILGDNFFVFNYDWRQPVEDIANDLRNYITNHINPVPETEIDLVGHSLGGIVARTYVQNNPEDHQVDQLVTLGSPHHGAPQTYYLWEGADLNQTLSEAWQRVGAGILIQLKKRSFENNVETVQSIVPVIGKLLPDFSYLKEKGSPKSLDKMAQKNTWLKNLNILPLPQYLTSKTTTILGKNGDTLRWINIQPRTSFDRLLGKWEDGRPIREEFAMGDGSTLEQSGQLEGALIIDIEGLNHEGLVETITGQEKVMEILGLSPSAFAEAPEALTQPLLVFQLASPAHFAVFGPSNWQIGEGTSNNVPNGVYNSRDKLIIIPEPLEGNYQIRVTGEGTGGDYRLLIGNINQVNDIWKEENGQVGEGETTVHQITFSKDQKINKLDLLKLAQKKFGKARETTSNCGYLSRWILNGLIQQKSLEIRKIIYLLRFGKERLVRKELKETIQGLIELEKTLDYFSKSCSQETKQDLLFLLREARDYLLQALEI